ncbi:MAG: sigma-70 family RNA polymerase sigma factor [Candidatus Aminicenantes bacterium]|nr:sigma-70 family RNA polymerase sigma factor [Candidatus Aminicenantes bacterium]
MEIEEIIKKCMKGNQRSWKMLIDMYSKKIFNLAYQFTGSYETSEDLTQEIFIKVHNSLHKYDIGRNFNSWILTLSRNFLIDHYRKTKLETKKRTKFDDHYLDSEGHTDPEKKVLENQSKKTVWKGLKSLSPDVRMAVILRDIQEKKYEEIAEIMSSPLGTVKSRVNRGRIQLADAIKDQKEKNNEMHTY